MQNNYPDLFKTIEYVFTDLDLLDLAFTHPSYANEHNIDKVNTNQRIEFLGDAVLELVSSEFLYDKFKNYEEGKLTKLRAKLVCEDNLSEVARELKLYNYLLLGKGENINKVKFNDSIMCDTIECLIGAIYKDSGISDAKKFILKFILTENNINKSNFDYKSELQEYANAHFKNIKYDVVNETGPDHNKEFYINVYYGDLLIGSGFGKSKKDAEQNAASLALSKLKG